MVSASHNVKLSRTRGNGGEDESEYASQDGEPGVGGGEGHQDGEDGGEQGGHDRDRQGAGEGSGHMYSIH